MSRKQYNIKVCSYSDYFTYSEFKCECGKCSSPAYLNPKLITYLDEMRKHFNKPVVITSGIRCKKYNASLKGSIPTSGHLVGNAADVYIKGVKPKDIHAWWLSNVPDCYTYYGTPNMGSSVHVEVV